MADFISPALSNLGRTFRGLTQDELERRRLGLQGQAQVNQQERALEGLRLENQQQLGALDLQRTQQEANALQEREIMDLRREQLGQGQQQLDISRSAEDRLRTQGEARIGIERQQLGIAEKGLELQRQKFNSEQEQLAFENRLAEAQDRRAELGAELTRRFAKAQSEHQELINQGVTQELARTQALSNLEVPLMPFIEAASARNPAMGRILTLIAEAGEQKGLWTDSTNINALVGIQLAESIGKLVPGQPVTPEMRARFLEVIASTSGGIVRTREEIAEMMRDFEEVMQEGGAERLEERLRTGGDARLAEQIREGIGLPAQPTATRQQPVGPQPQPTTPGAPQAAPGGALAPATQPARVPSGPPLPPIREGISQRLSSREVLRLQDLWAQNAFQTGGDMSQVFRTLLNAGVELDENTINDPSRLNILLGQLLDRVMAEEAAMFDQPRR